MLASRGKSSTRDGIFSPVLELFAFCLLVSLPMSFCLPVRLWGHHSLPLFSWVTSQDQTSKKVFLSTDVIFHESGGWDTCLSPRAVSFHDQRLVSRQANSLTTT